MHWQIFAVLVVVAAFASVDGVAVRQGPKGKVDISVNVKKTTKKRHGSKSRSDSVSFSDLKPHGKKIHRKNKSSDSRSKSFSDKKSFSRSDSRSGKFFPYRKHGKKFSDSSASGFKKGFKKFGSKSDSRSFSFSRNKKRKNFGKSISVSVSVEKGRRKKGKNVSVSVNINKNRKFKHKKNKYNKGIKKFYKSSDSSDYKKVYFMSSELLVRIGSHETFNWGYSTRNGPAVWPYYVPIGKEQSPINICANDKTVGFDRTLKPLKFEYERLEDWTLYNNGRGFEVQFDNENNKICGGPYDCTKYVLHHVELHWGKTKTTGSLHTVDGKGYAAELVFAHYHKDRCDSWEKATRQKDGLLYVSVFVKTCAKDNDVFSLLLKKLGHCLSQGAKLRVDNTPIDLDEILPKDLTEYWTYTGSMPAPPLHESVTWVVLRQPITMSRRQLLGFQNFYPYNVRPTQKLYDRIVRSSFTRGVGHSSSSSSN